jgi:hypothetical protein
MLLFVLFSGFNYQTPLNYVPNKETAIKIAEAIWLPIYGEQINGEKPFIASLIGDSVWEVSGNMAYFSKKTETNGEITISMPVGGVAHALIRKSDGRVSEVYHTK